MESRKRKAAWTTVLTLLALGVAGCGTEEEPTAAETTEQSSATEDTSKDSLDEAMEKAIAKEKEREKEEKEKEKRERERAASEAENDSSEDVAEEEESPIHLDMFQTLEQGNHTVGVDIPAGEYVIRAQEKANVYFLNSDMHFLVLDPEGDNASEKVHTYLFDGLTFVLNTDVSFSEVASPIGYRNNLFSGHWLVGEHIRPGNYRITSEPDQWGRIIITDIDTQTPVFDSYDLVDSDVELQQNLDFEFDLRSNHLLEIINFNDVRLEKK